MDDERLTAAYHFELPSELIAQHPAPQRDASRLLVLRGERPEHRVFSDLPELVAPGDLFVLNRTAVIAARLRGRRIPSGGSVEVLLLHPATSFRYDPQATHWRALLRPARRLKVAERIAFADSSQAEVTAVGEDGIRELAFSLRGSFDDLLACGRLPLPPYIHHDSDEAQARYQSVFAETAGSVAAPTASLHFTPELLDRLRQRGVQFTRLCLDIGLGTFRPIQGETLDDHRMHGETYEISQDCIDTILAAKREGRRIVAVGTTVVRTLEGAMSDHGRLMAGQGRTELFIRPGFRFRVVDALITNFHLPASSLLVLVSAFGGRRRVLQAYEEAVRRRYRFFSFGDAMLIEPRAAP
ncbi:MAG: tRNA preQ1(34) S-adenosylmethionine ribosyltransferase-isomerase QueA [Vulcanimicrobiaceae bacterium]